MAPNLQDNFKMATSEESERDIQMTQVKQLFTLPGRWVMSENVVWEAWTAWLVGMFE